MTLDELEENFAFFEDWEGKYSYLIDLGKKIEPLEYIYKVDIYKVKGCTSNVWLVPETREEHLFFKCDSDALIVKGLLKILLCAYHGKTKEEITQVDIHATFTRLGLDQHLSPNRRNGFFSMVERIQRA